MRLILGSALSTPAPAPTYFWLKRETGPVLALGNTNAVPLALRTTDRAGFGPPQAGDLLIAFWGSAGYLGESLQSLRTPTFQIWGDTGGDVSHNASDTGEFTARLTARLATGDAEDTLVMFSNGPFPSWSVVVRFQPINGGLVRSPFNNILSANSSGQLLGNTDMLCEGLFTGGNPNNTISAFCSTKRATLAQTSSIPAGVGQGILTIVTGATPDNGFDQAMLYAAGYQISNAVQDPPYQFNDDDWTPSIVYSGDSFGVSGRYESDQS